MNEENKKTPAWIVALGVVTLVVILAAVICAVEKGAREAKTGRQEASAGK